MKNKVKLEDIIRNSPDAISLAKAMKFAGVVLESGVFTGCRRYFRIVAHPFSDDQPRWESSWVLVAEGAAAFWVSDEEERIKQKLKEGPIPGYAWEEVQVKITEPDGTEIDWL
jgi:hypothetical protein